MRGDTKIAYNEDMKGDTIILYTSHSRIAFP